MEAFRLTVANVPTTITAGTSSSCPEGFARCKVTKNATGDFTITLLNPFKRAPVVTASALHATAKLFVSVVSASTSATRLTVYSDAGTLTDPTEVHAQILGFDTADQLG
jgi:hypothetical protein